MHLQPQSPLVCIQRTEQEGAIIGISIFSVKLGGRRVPRESMKGMGLAEGQRKITMTPKGP